MTLDVRLPWPQWRHAAYVGIDRYVRARSAGRKNSYGQSESDWTADVLGAIGECAVARVTDRYWQGDLGRPDHGEPDVGPFHVRTTSRRNGDLRLHPSDRDDEPYVLVEMTDPPLVRIVGWCYAREGKRPEFWQTFTGRPCYFTPPAVACRPLSEWGIP